jgi:hypothetical protein
MNRRSFLGLGAASAVAAALPPTETPTPSSAVLLHAIDPSAYMSNPDLQRIGDHWMSRAGVSPDDTINIAVYSEHAELEVFEYTSEGKTFIRNDDIATRLLIVR